MLMFRQLPCESMREGGGVRERERDNVNRNVVISVSKSDTKEEIWPTMSKTLACQCTLLMNLIVISYQGKNQSLLLLRTFCWEWGGGLPKRIKTL